jgi:hypothetical protein
VGEKKPTAEEVGEEGEEEGTLKHSMQRLEALRDDPVLAEWRKRIGGDWGHGRRLWR